MSKQEKKHQILIVDDDQDMRIFLSNLLKAQGFAPITAGHGAQGLKKAMKHAPEIILLDIPMPEKNCFGMFHSLKQHETLTHIPVIMMSTLDYNMFSQYKKQHQSILGNETYEPDGYLRKPPESDELFSLLHQILEQPGKAL